MNFRRTHSIFISVFSLFVALVLTSCEFWQQPIRGYFEEWTEECSIAKYELVGIESYTDKDGNLCIASDHDAPVKLYLINPYHYTLDTPQYPLDIDTPSPFPIITPDPNDTTVLHFTYEQSALESKEGGEEIGGTLTMHHPVNPTSKEFTFSLKCNSRPPEVVNPAIMLQADSADPHNKYYVLAFELPSTSVTKSDGIHKDIESITIDGTTYPITIDASGNMTFEDDKFDGSTPNPSLELLNKRFTHSTNSMYFYSGILAPTSDDEKRAKTFTIGYTDKAGLKTTKTVEAKLPAIAAPTVEDNDGNCLTDDGTVNTLHIDFTTPDAAYTTLTLTLPDVDDIGETYEGGEIIISKLYYNGSEITIATGESDDPTASSSTGSDGTVTLKIHKEGDYTLQTFTKASGHSNSVTKTYKLKLAYADLDIPVVEKNTDALSTSINNYIELDTNQNYSTVTISAPTSASDGPSVSGASVEYKLYQGMTETGNPYDKSDAPETGPINLTNMTLGQWTLVVTATKTGYHSSTATYHIRPYASDLYVKSSDDASPNPGSDSTGDGSQTKPYATIERCIQEIQVINKSTAEYTIHIIGTLTGAQTIDGGYLNDNAAKLTIKGEGSTGILSGNSSAVPLSITTTVPVFITDLKITGGIGDYGGGLYCKADVTLQNGVEISGNNATYSGGGIYLKTGSLTIENGVKIQNNSAKNGGGIVIDPDSTTVTIKGGTISENTATNGYGSGIYALKTFTVTEDAKIDSSNDVYLGSDKYINIDGTLNNNSVATITKGSQTDSNQWRRGTKVLTGDVPTTPSQKFTVAKTGWYVRNYSDDGYLDAPIFISGSGNNSANTGATADDAYKTLDAAALLCWNSDIDFTIKVVGEVQWSHTIKDDLNGKAKSLTLEGTDDGGTLKYYSGNKSVLTVNTSVPVIIKNLTITGGTYKEGAGISIASGGTVKLGDGATVTGNTATASVGSEAKGGGVYVSSGAKLFMYGKSLIGDKSKTDYATSGDYANKAVTTGGGTSYGGGIYNEGTVYLGYDAAGSQKSIDDGYGVRYNYAYLGGGIYNSGTVYLNTGNISYNQASANGGGIDNNSGTVSISGGTIKGNHAINAGGVLHLGGTFGISGGSLESNSASSHGGAIYANSAFTLSGSPNISSNGTRNSNDVFFDTTSGNFSVSVSGNLGGSGNIYLDGLTSGDYKFYKHGYTALTGSITADNCNKFKVIDTWWKIGSDGKVKLNRDISVTYDINISDSKAAPAASSFTFTKSGTTITNPDSIHADKFGTTDAKPAQPSSDYYIGTDDKIYKFKGWENAAGTVSIGSSVTKLPESLLSGLVSPSVTLKAQWEEVTDNDEKNAAWSTFVYDENFYNNHNTFNVYTINQAKQIFDCNTTGSLCKAGKDFKDKIIKICSDINIGSIQTSAKAEIDGFAAQINFRGELDGNGKTITADITGNTKVGLIAVLNDGNIHNLKLAGTVTAGQNNCDTGGIVGAISGYPGRGTINYCTVSATIKDTLTNNVSASVGGIAGSMVTGTVKNCTVTSSTVIKGKFVVGGIVGWYSDDQDAVKNNTYEGKIYHTGTSGHTGKIIGKGSLSNTSNTASNGTISMDNAVTLNTSGY